MTREEAIAVLRREIEPSVYEDEKSIAEAIDMAIEALHREEAEEKGWCHRIIPKPNCQKCAIKELWEATEKEDLVEVVRCKDCRYRDLFSCPLADNDFQKDEDFCSWGERREP